MSKQRPILFSTPMVQAILAGRKTQTRRVVKPRSYITDVVDGVPYEMTDDDSQPIKCPYGKLGDVLWVRETWADGSAVVPKISDKYIYKADISEIDGRIKWAAKWKPSIHMPKEAARIWLRITNVRVERVQYISSCDIKAEGVPYTIDYYPILLDLWENLWVKINGEQSWNSNPWVWVVEFERIKKPENTYTNV